MKKLLNRNQFFQNAVFAPWREYIFCIQASRQKLPSDNQQAKLARTKNETTLNNFNILPFFLDLH
jgi:hypothetical protein